MPRTSLAGAFRVRFVAVLAAMYIVVVLVVTLWPSPVDRGLDPYIDRLLDALHTRGVPTFVDYAFVEFSANIAFFVPVGLLGALLPTYRLWWTAIPAGAAFSGAIEVSQGLFLPGRVASVADVVANTAGSILGALAAFALRTLILHRDVLVIRDVREGRRAADGLSIRG